MFLKSIKQKINKNYINKLLKQRKATIVDGKIESVGILLLDGEFDNLTPITNLLKELNIDKTNYDFKIFTNIQREDLENSDLYFNDKTLGWNGKVNNDHVNTFANKDFDLLISYYKTTCIELDILTAKSCAKFKVGLHTADERLYDLIIDTKPEQFVIFEAELKKYLTILNKL